MTRIEPRINMVLVKPRAVDDKRGHILIPTSVQRREQAAVTEGEVIAIGPDAWVDYHKDEGAKIGDWVAFAQYAGLEVKDKKTGEKFVLMNDDDIKATLIRSEDDKD